MGRAPVLEDDQRGFVMSIYNMKSKQNSQSASIRELGTNAFLQEADWCGIRYVPVLPRTRTTGEQTPYPSLTVDNSSTRVTWLSETSRIAM